MAEELVDEKPLDEEPAELTDEDLDRIADTAIGALQVTRAVSARSSNRLPVLPRTAQLARTAASSFVR